MKGYVLISDMSRTERLVAKKLPVAFVYNTDELCDYKALIKICCPADVPFIVLGKSDADEELVKFFGENRCSMNGSSQG